MAPALLCFGFGAAFSCVVVAGFGGGGGGGDIVAGDACWLGWDLDVELSRLPPAGADRR